MTMREEFRLFATELNRQVYSWKIEISCSTQRLK